jgi:hypothetical protein
LKSLLPAIGEILDLLAACEPRPEFAAQFQSCRDRLAADPADAEALMELYVLTAPKGFLGDGPLYARPGGPLSQAEIDRRSAALVEKIQAHIAVRLEK